jgi:hypothetical protein
MKVLRFARLVMFAIIAGRCCVAPAADSAATTRDRPFDSSWRFLRADAPGAEAPGFDDSSWCLLDVPHDWSIEDLPPLEKSLVPELSVTVGQWRFHSLPAAALPEL